MPKFMFGTILQFLSEYACCLYKIWSNNFVQCTALGRQYTGHLFNAFKFNGKRECLMVNKGCLLFTESDCMC